MSAGDPCAVLFDLDGLLIDSEVLWSEADARFLADRGVVPGDDLKSLVMGTTVLESASAMKHAYGVEGTPESIAEERLARVADLYRERLVPLPGAEAALERCGAAGFRLALATASSRPLVAVVFERLPWERLFAAVVTGDGPAKEKRSARAVSTVTMSTSTGPSLRSVPG